MNVPDDPGQLAAMLMAYSLNLQDLTSPSAKAGGQRLLLSLTSFINFVLHGNVPPSICEVFFGASLTALLKNTPHSGRWDNSTSHR